MSPFGKQHYWAAITDASGLRTSKTVGNTTTQYYWLGDKLQAQKTGNDYLIFLYDEAGVPYGLIHKYGSTEITYYYEYNLQGDIIGIINDAGTRVVTYQYSAWGELLSISGSMASNIGATNPLRYRGYYYDTETGLYYLQSRYYDPITGRFINEDTLVSTGQGILGNNMFAYCRNNPVCRKDATGTDDICVTDINDDDNPLNDAGTSFRPGGASGGGNVSGSVGSNTSGRNNGYGRNDYATANKMRQVAEKGKAGEIAADIPKNHTHIDSLTGTAKFRIPDMLNKTEQILGEVKNYSGTISYTAQLKDFVLWSQLNGYQMYLFTNSASFSGPLQQVIDVGVIQVFPIGSR